MVLPRIGTSRVPSIVSNFGKAHRRDTQELHTPSRASSKQC